MRNVVDELVGRLVQLGQPPVLLIQLFVGVLQLNEHLLPLERITQNALKTARCNLVFVEVVLGTPRDRVDADGVVAAAGQNHDRDLGIVLTNQRERLQSTTIGQTQIEQQNVARIGCLGVHGRRKTVHAVQRKTRAARIGQSHAHNAHVVRIVLDQEHFQMLLSHGFLRGSGELQARMSQPVMSFGPLRERSTGT